MKKHFILLLCYLFCTVNAQESNFNSSLEKPNIIKTNITGYIARNINLSYERSINQWLSINMGFGLIPQGKVPFINAFLNNEDEKRFHDLQIKYFHFTIEPRFYIGQGYGKGFYIAPYYRYSKITSNTFNFSYNYNIGTGMNVELPLQSLGSTHANSGGMMLGVQFFLTQKQNLVLDLWIAGAHYGKVKGDFTLTSNDILLTPDMQAQLKQEIENLDIPFVKYTVETNPNGAAIKVDGPWLGFRTGLSLGYRF
ncbi:DUF3575 domain-containing protein [Chryseobacterium potabilaquae]|uniref:DUF3575 domain-containing protein n=1 Tax=Chryseobacterium potabilaquae TaxID=2675057 RepID=A0A6N4X7Q0_9FLAO|nr:DUF3575 domain-containing protein [Chryseobacterium potabilaquae]CAA7197123.1 hypothetical protein CHRY9293_03178 [Chryseobacterium potabilaquae]